MLEKVVGVQIELKSKTPKENEELCDTCGGIGWLCDRERGVISACPDCYTGIITLCPICKQPKKGVCVNLKCRELRDAEDEQKRLEKAVRANYKDVPPESKKMMYSRIYPYNEGYFGDIDDLLEYCQDNGVSVPPHVWSTEKTSLSMDAGSIIEDACEKLHENAIDNIDGEKELQEFLDGWCAKQTGTDTYMVDYKYAIEVDDA